MPVRDSLEHLSPHTTPRVASERFPTQTRGAASADARRNGSNPRRSRFRTDPNSWKCDQSKGRQCLAHWSRLQLLQSGVILVGDGPTTDAPTVAAPPARSACLLASADLEHLRAALRTRPLSCRAPVRHGDQFRAGHRSLGLALHAVTGGDRCC